MTCRFCKQEADELRLGCCWECATDGDLRLGRRTVIQHLRKGVAHAARGWWLESRIDFACAWERLTRTGKYRPGGEWEAL